MSDTSPILEARGIHKRFPGVHALNAVDAAFLPGEVAAVMGENGAGKSTLMKCLAGVYHPDEGEILWEGKPVEIDSVNRATDLGIAFIHQELNLADNLSIGANIFLGREPRKGGPLGWIDHQAIRERTLELLAQLDLRMSPDTLVQELSIGHQQMVEIAKALSLNARLLIMDEPTSSLTQHETATLMGLVKRLRSEGMSIVFISHRIAEVEEIADRVLVLLDGQNSGSLEGKDIEHDQIVSLMVGRELTLHHRTSHAGEEKPNLEVKSLRTSLFPKESVSFQLRPGEIVGMAGLVGAGRTEVARAIFGVDRRLSGTFEIRGEEIDIRSPKQAVEAGIALTPEDRKSQGLLLETSIRDNIALASLPRLNSASFVQEKKIDSLAESTKDRLSIRTPSLRKEVGLLSGGNQQKVVIGKWVARNPSVFLLDEPTRGIDVRSKSQIYALIEELAQSGAAVLVISSDLEEILRVSDRVLVMHEGRIAGELDREELSEESVMQLATGASLS